MGCEGSLHCRLPSEPWLLCLCECLVAYTKRSCVWCGVRYSSSLFAWWWACFWSGGEGWAIWVRGLTGSSHETLFCCRRPVIVGLHSVVLPSERVRLSGTCWILIRMVGWTRLVASICFFQRTASVLAPKLSHLFRKLWRCGEFPLEWRIADVTPIPKDPLSALVCNYQPISITPVLSKVFKRLISLRFGRSLERSGVLSSGILGRMLTR